MPAVAREAGVPFTGLWLDAPPDVLAGGSPIAAADASDATADVLERQLRVGDRSRGLAPARRIGGRVHRAPPRAGRPTVTKSQSVSLMESTDTGLARAAAFVERVAALQRASTAPARSAPTCPRRCTTASARSRTWSRELLPASHARARGRLAQPVLLAAGRVRSRRVGRAVPRDRRSRRGRPAVPLPRHGRAHRHAGLRRERSGGRSAPCSSRCRSSSSRYAHSEYQTVAVAAPQGRAEPHRAGRHAAPLRRQHRRRGGRERDQGGADEPRDDVAGRRRRLHRVVRRRVPRPHARRLAVTHRKKARLGFPTFDWPHIPFPVEEPRSPKETVRREERSLKQLWDLLVSGRLPHAEKSKDTYRREMDALDEFLAQPGRDVHAFVAGAARAASRPTSCRRVAPRRRRARRADSGRGRRAPDERALHAQAAAADAHLRRAARLRRGADRLGHDRPAVGARAVRSAVPARRGDLGEEGAERRPLRQRGAGDVLPGGEEVQHDVGRRLGRHGAAARAARQAGSRSGAAHRRARASAGSRRWRATTARS